VLRAVVAIAAIVVALIVFVRWLEPRFAFFPETGETSTPADLGVDFSTMAIETRDGERLHGWLLRSPAPRARIVYFHGNGGNLSVWTPILSDLARRGYDVLAVDYRGYGRSTGRPSERGLYRDADAIVEHAATAFTGPPQPWHAEAPQTRTLPLIYWGRSLGTAVAAYAASRRQPDGIILEAGFPDGRSIVRASPILALLALVSTYRFGTADFLAGVRAPVLVIHGDADRVIPFALGRELFDRLQGAKTFVTIPGGDHNDVRPADERTYWNAVDAFVGSLKRSS